MREILDQLEAWFGWLTRGVRWVAERWSISYEPDQRAVIAVLALAVVLCSIRPVWLVLRHGVTIIHEMGHVVMGWLWGRRVQGVSLHTDTSGLTITSGRERGLGVLMTYLAGYTAPPLFGLALVWSALNGWSGAALTAMLALLLAAFWLVSNIFGLIVVGAAIAGTWLVFRGGDAKVVSTFVVAVGLFMLVAACRGAFDLWAVHDHGDGETSDASMAAEHSLLPPRFWVLFFGVVSFLCAIQAGGMLLLGRTPFAG